MRSHFLVGLGHKNAKSDYYMKLDSDVVLRIGQIGKQGMVLEMDI